MVTSYVLIVGFLFLLAISLLIIGVSNDAVNFLNSAIGSKAAPFKIILLIAAIGVLMGAVFSNGMMEVARKGIFNPEFFSFSEIMVIFLAVMLANILLLDFFNTVGLPTSTTISIVFGILGAAVAIAMMKVAGTESSTDSIGNYINIESSVLIIVGIFLSIVIAFNIGFLCGFGSGPALLAGSPGGYPGCDAWRGWGVAWFRFKNCIYPERASYRF